MSSYIEEPLLPSSRLRSSITPDSTAAETPSIDTAPSLSNPSISSDNAFPSMSDSSSATTETSLAAPPARRQGLRPSTTIKRSNSLYYVRAACNNASSLATSASASNLDGKGKSRDELVDVEMGEPTASSLPSPGSWEEMEARNLQAQEIDSAASSNRGSSDPGVRVVKHQPKRLVRSHSYSHVSNSSRFGSDAEEAFSSPHTFYRDQADHESFQGHRDQPHPHDHHPPASTLR